MATKKKTAVGQTDPAPSPAPATGSITLPEMPPAETFVGLVAYGVDTTANESRHIPLEFLGRGVQACIDATNASITQTAAAGTATEGAVAAKQGANEAAETARTEAANLSALKEAVADATADAIEKTKAAETATGAANTATTNANEATADAIAKTNAAQTATEGANTAKDAAIEATENLTADVSALVLTDANRPWIQELAAVDRELAAHVEYEVKGEKWIINGVLKQVYIQRFVGTTPNTNDPNGAGFGFAVMTLCSATDSVYVRGHITGIPPFSFVSSASINFNNNLYWTYDSYAGLRVAGAYASITNPTGNLQNNLGNKAYDLVFKYTK